MTPRTITITLRLPGRILAPNGRPHFMAKANAVKQYRLLAWAEFTRAGWKGTPCKNATAEAKFYFRTNRRRDIDNCAASLKSVWDSLQDAGIIENDCGLVSATTIIAGADLLNPRVEITVREMQK